MRVRAALAVGALCVVTAVVPGNSAAAAPTPPAVPGVTVEPLATGPGAIIQSDYGTEYGHPGNLEVVVLQGHDLVHYWHDSSQNTLAWHRGQVITHNATGPGSIIQSDYTSVDRNGHTHGNLEVVVPEGGHLQHYWHDAEPNTSWHAGQSFGSGITGAPSFIQSDFGKELGNHGNFEVVAPEGSTLVHFFHNNGATTNPWGQDPNPVATGVSSAGSLIQSDFGKELGNHGNLEVVAQVGDHLTHYWHNSGDTSAPWQVGASFGSGVTGAPVLIQSDFGRESGPHGNFEVVAPTGDHLQHYFKINTSSGTGWSTGQTIATGSGRPAGLVQSTIGQQLSGGTIVRHGNFELVALGPATAPPPGSAVDGGVADFTLQHWFHDNGDVANPWQRGQDITYRGRSEKVCQLTGTTDEETGQPTNGDSASMAATDLGYPVDDGDTLTMLFGDSRTSPGTVLESGESGHDDAMAASTSTAAPTVTGCLPRSFAPTASGSPNPFRTAVLTPTLEQGLFNVPASGFTANGGSYGVFWTDHCAFSGSCPNGGNTQYGRTVLAQLSGDGQTYQQLYGLPQRIVYSATQNTDTAPGLPAGQQTHRVYLWGVGIPDPAAGTDPSRGLYRRSDPILAYADTGEVQNASSWHYFTGYDASGAPQWSADPTAAVDLFAGSGTARDYCTGESSVSWVAPLNKWVMLYNCDKQDFNGGAGGNIRARVAPNPWGPWSDPQTVFNPNADQAYCRYMHRPDGFPSCDDHLTTDNGTSAGGPYAPYLLPRFTTATTTGASVYYLMSTWNPYQVVIMHLNLTG